MIKRISLIVLLVLPLCVIYNINSVDHPHLGRTLLSGVGIGILALANLAVTVLNIGWRRRTLSVINGLMVLPWLAMTVGAARWNIVAGLVVGLIAMVHIVMVRKSVVAEKVSKELPEVTTL